MMIFIQFLGILLILTSPGSTWRNSDIEQSSQLKSLETPHPELEELWLSHDDLEGLGKPVSRDQRKAGMLSKFIPSPSRVDDFKAEHVWQKEADIWYRQLLKRGGLHKRSTVDKQTKSVNKDEKTNAVDQAQDTEEATDTAKAAAIQKQETQNQETQNQETQNQEIQNQEIQNQEETEQRHHSDDKEQPHHAVDNDIPNLDMKLKNMQEIFNEQESLEDQNNVEQTQNLPKKNMEPNENQSEMENPGSPVPRSAYEQTLNRLSSKLHKTLKNTPKRSALHRGSSKPNKRSSSRSFDVPETKNEIKNSEELAGFNQFDFRGTNNKFEQSNEQMMSPPKIYDKSMPYYGQFYSQNRDYKRSNRKPPTYLDRYERDSDPVRMVKQAPAAPQMHSKGYADAVVSLMANEMSSYKDREKRHSRHRRAKRSLENNYDYMGFEGPSHCNELHDDNQYNDSVALVHDPTKNLVPMMSERPKPLPPSPSHQEIVQPQPEPKEITNFMASFNLSTFIDDIQKLENSQSTETVQSLQQPLQVAIIQAADLPEPIDPSKPSTQPIRSFGLRRFLGSFLRNQLKTTTMYPDCVPISRSTNATTSAPASTTCIPSTNTNTNNTTKTTNNPNKMDKDCKSQDSVKLNVSIKAHLCSDPKSRKFFGNGSISMQPPFGETEGNYELQDVQKRTNKVTMKQDDRGIRDVNGNVANKWEFNHERKQGGQTMRLPGRMRANNKYGTFHKMPTKLRPQYVNNWNPTKPRTGNYYRLISGEMSKDIVAAVNHIISRDSELAELLPVLQRNDKDSQKQILPETDLIEKYLRRDACIPLRPDLQEFYDLILKTAEEEEQARQKRMDEVLKKHKATTTEFSPRFIKLEQTAELLESKRRSQGKDFM